MEVRRNPLRDRQCVYGPAVAEVAVMNIGVTQFSTYVQPPVSVAGVTDKSALLTFANVALQLHDVRRRQSLRVVDSRLGSVHCVRRMPVFLYLLKMFACV
jgi:hypothetical protein